MQVEFDFDGKLIFVVRSREEAVTLITALKINGGLPKEFGVDVVPDRGNDNFSREFLCRVAKLVPDTTKENGEVLAESREVAEDLADPEEQYAEEEEPRLVIEKAPRPRGRPKKRRPKAAAKAPAKAKAKATAKAQQGDDAKEEEKPEEEEVREKLAPEVKEYDAGVALNRQEIIDALVAMGFVIETGTRTDSLELLLKEAVRRSKLGLDPVTGEVTEAPLGFANKYPYAAGSITAERMLEEANKLVAACGVDLALAFVKETAGTTNLTADLDQNGRDKLHRLVWSMLEEEDTSLAVQTYLTEKAAN